MTRSTGQVPAGPLLLDGRELPMEHYAPVIAVTVLRDGADGTEVLTVVRRPETNATHPDVLSVPTMRVPVGLADHWPSAASDATGIAGLAFCVEALLSRKLGLADVLELGEVRYRLGRLGAWQGTSFIGVDGERDITEDLTMFNVAVYLTRGGHHVPAGTASLAPITWTREETFHAIVETGDVALLDADLDAVLVCVRGLCVETSRRLLQSA